MYSIWSSETLFQGFAEGVYFYFSRPAAGLTNQVPVWDSQASTPLLMMMGTLSFNPDSSSDLVLAVAQMVSMESYHTATEPINPSTSQINNSNENLQYINPTNLTEIFRIRSTPKTHPAMNNLNNLHPHPPILSADVEQMHPITGLQLVLAAMSLISNSTVIAEIQQD